MKKQLLLTVFLVLFLYLVQPITHVFAADSVTNAQTGTSINYYPDETLGQSNTQTLYELSLVFFVTGLAFVKIPEYVKKRAIPFTIPYLGSNQNSFGY